MYALWAGPLDADNIRPFSIVLPKMIEHIKTFDETKCLLLLLKMML